MTDSIMIKIVSGSSRVESRFVEDGDRLHGEGRRIDYDSAGMVTSVGAWSRTGVSMGWDDGSPITSRQVSVLLA